MSALKLPSERDNKLVPVQKQGVDRKALRERINQRYEHTLRRLGQ